MKVLLIDEMERIEVGFSTYVNNIKENLRKLNVDVTTTSFETPHIPLLNMLENIRKFSHINGYDVYHVTSQGPGYLLNFFDIKNSVVSFHDIFDLTGGRPLLNRFRSIPSIKGMMKAKYFIVHSNFVKNELISRLNIDGGRIFVANLGVDHNKFKKNVKYKNYIKQKINYYGPLILYVGSEEPRKNVEGIVKSLSILKKNFLSDFRFVKVGAPEWRGARERVLKLIQYNGLNENCIFLDYVKKDELVKIYNSADIFVFPSLLEGFGRPPLEAMSCGCPVITSNTGSLPEVVGDAAIKVDPMDENTIAEALYELINDSVLRKNLSSKSIKHSKKFTWMNMTKKLKAVYETL